MHFPNQRMRRLAPSDLLPERVGQPVRAWVHVSLAELRAMDDGSVLETRWVTEMRIRWAARRAEAADGAGSDGGAWLDGAAARAIGLASFLRTSQLGARLAGPNLPLDIGYSATIPAGIRNAVILRDRHCRWAGGCHQPAAACEVHHVKHKANGGKTSTKDCVLLCWFHYQVVIHRWGWTLVLNPDGTTTAWNPAAPKPCTATDHPPAPGNARRCITAQ
jgi:hypothetical protein